MNIQNRTINTLFFGILGAFITYFSMYAFRKPFTANTYQGLTQFGIDYKIVCVIAQTIGYALSKLIGIKIISELKESKRIPALFILIGIAQLSLIGFGLLPTNIAWICLFFNGLPLGLIWGVVFSFIEGRKQTEIIASFLASSFIISSGLVKAFGLQLVKFFSIDIFWMPAATGFCFIPFLILGAFFLTKIPAVNQTDILERKERTPMTKAERLIFLRNNISILAPLLVLYVGLTVFRDLRDNFQAEIFIEHNILSSKSFAQTESIISIILLTVLMVSSYFKSNQKAFRYNLILLILSGIIILGVSTLFYMSLISVISWVLGIGIGVYMGYIPFNATIFERLLAMQTTGKQNIGFVFYLADSLGYIGSIFILLFKEFGQFNHNWTSFMLSLSLTFGVGSILVNLYLIKKIRVYK